MNQPTNFDDSQRFGWIANIFIFHNFDLSIEEEEEEEEENREKVKREDNNLLCLKSRFCPSLLFVILQ